MHELGVTENILKVAIAEAEKHSATRVKTIRLKIGAATHIEPSSIELYLEQIARGTIAEGAAIEAEIVPLTAKCRECGEVFPVEDQLSCPKCTSPLLEEITGRELAVESLDIDYD